MKIAIVTDSSCDITQELGKKLDIHILATSIYDEDKVYQDGIDINEEKIFELLRNKRFLRTSQIEPERVKELATNLLKNHDYVIFLPVASGLSSAYSTNKALSNSEEFKGKLIVIDLQRVSVELKEAVLKIRKIANTKDNIEDVLKEIEEIKKKDNEKLFFIVENIEFLRRNGRVSATVAALCNFIGFKPILFFHQNKIEKFDKCRSIKKGYLNIIEDIKKNNITKESHNLIIIAPKNHEDIKFIKSKLEEEFPGFSILISPINCTILTHTGPDIIGLGYVNNYN